MSKFNAPSTIMKRAQNRNCISSICEQSLGKVSIKRNENFWSYRLRKLVTPYVLRTDRQTGGRTDGWMDGVDPLLDLLSLKRRK